MFLPSSLGMVLPRALLDPVDESIWQPAVGPVSGGGAEAEAVGINLGCLVTAQTIGDIHTLCYYRTAAMPATGTLSLWTIAFGVDTLLAQVDFTGHTTVGWQLVPLATPIKSNPAKAYVVSLWTPAVGGTINYVADSGYFTTNGRYSENQFLYAMVSNGQFDARGFTHRNGLYDYGAFARPTQTFGHANYWVDMIINARPKPIPPDPPVIIKWPIPPGYPNLDNTGPDPDTVFTTMLEDVASSADGQIIENLDVHGQIAIAHDNVTVRHCKTRHAIFPIYMVAGTTGAIIEYNFCDGGGRNNGGSAGIQLQGAATVRFNNVQRVENGIAVGNANAVVLIEGNFIHNLRAGPGTPHYDGMQCDGGNGNMTIRNNTIFNENGDTAGGVMLDNIGGPSDDVLIEDNYCGGGGFTMYCAGTFPPVGTLTNVRYYRNLLRQGGYGYFYIQEATPELAGNQFVDHGMIYDYPPPGGFTVGQDVPECFSRLDSPIVAVLGEDVAAGTGLTLGLSFAVAKPGKITAVKMYRPGHSSISTVKIGLWRWTGSNKTGSVELLATKLIENVGRKNQWACWNFDTPIDVTPAMNLLVGVFVPRGSDGKVWYGYENGAFTANVPSQYGTMTAFNNHAVIINGFAGCNGMYEYGPDITPPVKAGGADSTYYIDPIFVAPWSGP